MSQRSLVFIMIMALTRAVAFSMTFPVTNPLTCLNFLLKHDKLLKNYNVNVNFANVLINDNHS